MKFTIQQIHENGNIDVSFAVDGKVQTLANLPLDNKQTLLDALIQYGVAYEAGLSFERLQTTVSDPGIYSLVGQEKTVDADVAVADHLNQLINPSEEVKVG